MQNRFRTEDDSHQLARTGQMHMLNTPITDDDPRSPGAAFDWT